MNKKNKNKKRRHVYPYICQGCQKKRWAFVFERAKNQVCTKCEIAEWNEKNQARLFDTTPSE